MEDKALNNTSSMKTIIKSLIIQFLVSIVLLFILSILLSSTNLEEKIIAPAVISISAFSILLGGLLSSRKLKLKGIIAGGIQGVLYIGILYLTSSIINSDFSLGSESIIMILTGILAGIIGGIIGANIK